MVGFTISVRGLDAILSKYETLPENLETHITAGLLNVASEFVNVLLDFINVSYPPPSEPGEAPHVRTGALKRSVRIDSVEPLRVTVAAGGPGSIVPYAGFLESGTSKMAPRPFVGPTTQDFSRLAADIMMKSIERGLAGSMT